MTSALTRRELLAMGLTTLVGSACRANPLLLDEPRQPIDASTHRSFVPDVELAFTAAPGEASILPGAPTEVWRFTGSVLAGPSSILEHEDMGMMRNFRVVPA